MSRSVPLILTLLVVALACAACRDQCDPDQFTQRCDGNTAVTCPEPGVDQLVPVKIAHTDCGPDTCVVSQGAAFCALSSSPDPVCPSDGGGAACDGSDAKVYCTQGFATARFPCLSCAPTDAGLADCQGGPASACTGAADCAQALRCSDRGFCAVTDAGA